jgi:hypothetical protein
MGEEGNPIADCNSETVNLSVHVGDGGAPVDARKIPSVSAGSHTIDCENDEEMAKNSSMAVHNEISIVIWVLS